MVDGHHQPPSLITRVKRQDTTLTKIMHTTHKKARNVQYLFRNLRLFFVPLMTLLLIDQCHGALTTNVYWFSPVGAGSTNGLSISNSAPFYNYFVNKVMQDATNSDITFRFLPGDYMVGGTNKGHPLTSDSIYIQGTTNSIVKFIGETSTNGQRIRFILGRPTDVKSWTNSGPKHQWMIKVGGNAQSGYSYLKRIEIENITLDGNFDDLGAWTSEANISGYKNFALDLASETGRVKNVQIKRFGAIGLVPLSHLDNFGGTEAFPIWVHTFSDGQAPQGGDSHPWVLEDIEVSDLRTLHSGYATVFMPICYQPTHGAVGDSPVVVVRRCQLRGMSGLIASGTAGGEYKTLTSIPAHSTSVYSGRIRFEDNVFLNTGAGFNTDTGSVGPLVFTNNAFLDMTLFGNLGCPDNPGYPLHNGYAFNDNIIRLVGRDVYKNYRDICVDDPNTAATDPNLGLGRMDTNVSDGLMIQGKAWNVYLKNNDFTTWPLASFYRPNPTNSAEATYRLIWKIPSNTPVNCTFYARSRDSVSNLVLSSNRISTVGYDFASFTNLSSGTYSAFTINSAPDYNNPKPAMSSSPTGFTPGGRVERVLLVTNGNSRLTAIREVQLAPATYSAAGNGTLTVVARLADQRLAAGGVTGTLAKTGQTLLLTNSILLTNGSVIVGVWTNTTGTNGTATFTITNLNGIHGVCRLAAWFDGGTVNSVLDPDLDAWASSSYSLGTTVELTASPDVGDDKNTASAKRAKIRVTRSGSTAASLTVNIALTSGVVYRPTDTNDLAATYGTSGTADYSITSGTGTWSISSPYTSGTITIPAGAISGDVQVITRADNITEQNIITVRLAASSSYALGIGTNVSIAIFDGPLWTLMELTGNYGGGTYLGASSDAYALSELSGANQPDIAGYGSYRQFYNPGYGPTNFTGMYWALPGLSVSPLDTYNFVGISTDPVYLVGNKGTAARVTRISGTNFSLPNFVSAPSAAWGISSNASLIVGSSMNAVVSRPVAWVGTNVSYTISDLSSALNANWAGVAFGANSSNQVVGQMHVDYSGGWTGEVAFRTEADAVVQALNFNSGNGAGDILHAPGTSGGANLNAQATSVNYTGQAVGWFNTGNSTRAVYWPATALASDSVALNLGAWAAKIGAEQDSQSLANAVNNAGWIVGWSSTNGVGARAILKWSASTNAKDWIDLNDPHFVSGVANWVLKEATAINSAGYITGKGSYTNANSSFVLVPRALGN